MALGKTMVIALLLVAAITGCSSEKSKQDPAPHTGNKEIEKEVNENAQVISFLDGRQYMGEYSAFTEEVEPVEPLQIMYVQASRVRVRTSAEILDDNIAGVLSLNNKVEIVNPEVVNGFVEIRVLETQSEIAESEQYFFAYQYLGEKKNSLRENNQSPYFIVQNVATEKLRVYKKECEGDCAHTMVFETDMVVGEKTMNRGTMTVLGYFHISKWYKFYQDGAGVYPSWYHPNYPMPPKPRAGVMTWTQKKYMPEGYNKKGARGAFGWFTAHVAPNSHAQWTHGTIGWGSDGDKYIKKTRGALANLFANPRSHGCTRLDNEAIAYLRHLVAVGTPLIKIYAIEALADKELSRYDAEAKVNWQYILTRNGAREDGEPASRQGVLDNSTPESEWLEEGEYNVDVYPDLKGFSSGNAGAKASRNGNVYGLKAEQMKGVFLIDEGRTHKYSHPDNLSVGGYSDQMLPPFMQAQGERSYALPTKTMRALGMKTKREKRQRQRRRR